MPVQRSVSQHSQEIRDHYGSDPGMPDYDKKCNAMMVAFINRLEIEFPHTDIWLLTSLNRLILMDKPTYDNRWLVMIHYVLADIEGVEASYLIPDDQSPFPNARVSFYVEGFEQAIKYLRVAMRLSGGWPMSSEVANSTL